VTDWKLRRSMLNNVAEAVVEVKNAFGLHIRPAGIVSKTALSFRAKIAIIRGKDRANARSIVALTMLGAGRGAQLRIQAEGNDAESAVKAIAKPFEDKFGEE
jgi:phosphotransferase system HPr (HPr) family protein